MVHKDFEKSFLFQKDRRAELDRKRSGVNQQGAKTYLRTGEVKLDVNKDRHPLLNGLNIGVVRSSFYKKAKPFPSETERRMTEQVYGDGFPKNMRFVEDTMNREQKINAYDEYARELLELEKDLEILDGLRLGDDLDSEYIKDVKSHKRGVYERKKKDFNKFVEVHLPERMDKELKTTLPFKPPVDVRAMKAPEEYLVRSFIEELKGSDVLGEDFTKRGTLTPIGKKKLEAYRETIRTPENFDKDGSLTPAGKESYSRILDILNRGREASKSVIKTLKFDVKRDSDSKFLEKDFLSYAGNKFDVMPDVEKAIKEGDADTLKTLESLYADYVKQKDISFKEDEGEVKVDYGSIFGKDFDLDLLNKTYTFMKGEHLMADKSNTLSKVIKDIFDVLKKEETLGKIDKLTIQEKKEFFKFLDNFKGVPEAGEIASKYEYLDILRVGLSLGLSIDFLKKEFKDFNPSIVNKNSLNSVRKKKMELLKNIASKTTEDVQETFKKMIGQITPDKSGKKRT